jgi:hypothetical protein
VMTWMILILALDITDILVDAEIIDNVENCQKEWRADKRCAIIMLSVSSCGRIYNGSDSGAILG